MKTLLLSEIRDCIDARVADELSAVSVKGVSTDSRSVCEGDLFFAIRGEKFDGHEYVSAAFDHGAVGAVVETAGDDHTERTLVVDDTVKALGKLGSYYRDGVACTVIAVTGSNGKTTTKEMISHILGKHMQGRASQKSFNNFIGVPVTLLSAEAGDEFLVVEAGSNHPGEIDYLGGLIRPDVGVITSVAETHIEGFGDIDHVALEKSSLAGHIVSGGAVVTFGDMRSLLRMIGEVDGKLFRFGESEENDFRITQIRTNRSEVRFTVNGRFEFHLPVGGRHNAMNCLAAIAVARRMGLDMETIAEDLRDFKLPPMRLQIEHVNGMTVLNDAYNANPASMAAAVDTLEEYAGEGRLVMFCGDMLELGDRSEEFHRLLGKRIGEGQVEVLVTVGKDSRYVGKAAIEAGMVSANVRHFSSTRQASLKASEIVEKGDVVLLKGSRSVAVEKLMDAFTGKKSRKRKES